MQIVNKIDHLITKLNELKPALSDDPSSNEKRFNDLLTASIANNYTVTSIIRFHITWYTLTEIKHTTLFI